MEKSSVEKEMEQTPWPALFLVTGFSFLIFSLILKLLDGSSPPFLYLTGVFSSAVGILSLLFKKITKSSLQRKDS